MGVLPDFHLTSTGSQGGLQAFGPQDIRGAPWVADFVFTSCSGPCPLLSRRMAALQKSLPASIRLVSFTVDPDTDGPEVLREYARRNEAQPRRWRFVTGDKAGLFRLLRDGFRLSVVEDPAQPAGIRVTHSAKFVLVDAELTVRGYYDGRDEAELAALTRDALRLNARIP